MLLPSVSLPVYGVGPKLGVFWWCVGSEVSLAFPAAVWIKKRADGRWRVRYRDAAGEEHARHFPRKVDGQRWLDEVTTSVVTGMYVDPKTAKTTVATGA